jgi:hypothetical protein
VNAAKAFLTEREVFAVLLFSFTREARKKSRLMLAPFPLPNSTLHQMKTEKVHIQSYETKKTKERSKRNFPT